jgi:hypothetical protein
VSESQAICRQCRQELAVQDWTCPRCGEIIDRYLFSTVTLKSLEGESRSAYRTGYQECIRQAKQTGSGMIRPESYRPSPGNETAYRAGWQAAFDTLEAKEDRKFGRRRGLRVLGSGVVLLIIGLGIGYGSLTATNGRVAVLVYGPIGLGILNIVIGIAMMITGENDEARPS